MTATFELWNERDGLIGVLSESFPLRDAWNDLSGRPSEELLETNLKEYERQLDEFEKIYWDPARTNGALPICHLGCALRIWLVVSGEEAGHLWGDGRADDTGLSPAVSVNFKNNVRATFSSWYEEWLDEALKPCAENDRWPIARITETPFRRGGNIPNLNIDLAIMLWHGIISR